MKEPLKISDHFQSFGGFFFSFARVVLNVCSSAAIKVPTMELYVVFWDIPIPGCVSTVLWGAPQSRVLVLLIVLPRDP